MGSRFRCQKNTNMFLLVLCYILCCCCTKGSASGCIDGERQALLNFKHSVFDNASWSSIWVEEDCCKWDAVTCDNQTGHVVGFHFGGCDFEGTFPDSLKNLTSLKEITITMNLFRGPFPTFLENMTSLEMLNLYDNRFDGTLPNWFGRFKNLKYIDLRENYFHGPIPPSLGGLSSLTYLDLRDNQLNGTIPPGLGQLSQLEELYLSYNSFEGVMSKVHFATLSKLKTLVLTSNSLTLELGSEWVPPFQLHGIDLSSCKVGPRFPMWLRTQKEFFWLDMSNTSINDFIPEWFFNIYKQEIQSIDLSSNQLYGEVSRVSSNIGSLDFKDNNLEGLFPHFSSNVSSLDLSHNSFSGPLPQDIDVMLPNLETLDLSNNSFNGSIPPSVCKLNNLEFLDLSSNLLVGDLPQCKADELQFLSQLDLSINRLSGIIPNSTGYLVGLVMLYLSGNKLHGQVPQSLEKLNLQILDLGENNLSGNIPTWIGVNMTSLRILRLRNNQFSGVIPLQLCLLFLLQLLDLAQNNISGVIPHCFGNLRSMIIAPNAEEWMVPYMDKTKMVTKGIEYEFPKTTAFVIGLDLSSNKLGGKIPTELTNLVALKSLNLSENQLGGSIPDEIGKMVSLESLDLSGNLLSGRIPQSMSELTFLGYLNFSHNKLSGRIPSGNQLQTFNDPSVFTGNSGLCGVPLENPCPGDASPHLPPTINKGLQEDEIDESGMTGFYIGLASGHVVGFWGVCGVLFVNKTSRIAFFNFVSGFGSR